MKKMFILSISSIHLLVTKNYAQVQKSDFLLGGSLGFNTNETTNSPTRSNANITPRIGYAIANNSVLYLNLGYSFSRSKTDGTDYKSTTNSFSSGISWKRFISIKERFGLLLTYMVHLRAPILSKMWVLP